MDYTPTTEEVRDAFIMRRNSTSYSTYEDMAEDFDRWFAEVKAQAWEEGYNQPSFNADGSSYIAVNPYRQGENNE